MKDALIELEALREATRPRLSRPTRRALYELAEVYAAAGEASDRITAQGLLVLLAMHDKLEAIPRGQG